MNADRTRISVAHMLDVTTRLVATHVNATMGIPVMDSLARVGTQWAKSPKKQS